MKTHFLLIMITLLTGFELRSQGKAIPLAEFSTQFKADTNGCLRLRDKCIKYDRKNNILLINNLNIRGYSEKKVLEILGQQNIMESKKNKNGIIGYYYTYYISNHIKCTDDKYTSGIVIEFKDKKVVTVYLNQMGALQNSEN